MDKAPKPASTANERIRKTESISILASHYFQLIRSAQTTCQQQ